MDKIEQIEVKFLEHLIASNRDHVHNLNRKLITGNCSTYCQKVADTAWERLMRKEGKLER